VQASYFEKFSVTLMRIFNYKFVFLFGSMLVSFICLFIYFCNIE